MEFYQRLIEKAKNGFKERPFPENLKNRALVYLEIWLNKEMFDLYVPYVIHLINMAKWDLLIDSFSRLISFGTGGRRGVVGIGPNRINLCTVKTSAQDYSQYLIKNFGNSARKRGVVLAYDVRKSLLEGIGKKLSMKTESVVSSFQLAKAAASVYVANGIKVFIFNTPRSTPVLSFAIRHIKAIGGCVFTASHNEPHYNGEKFYNEQGSQFLPPYDEMISHKIKNYGDFLQKIDLENLTDDSCIEYIRDEVDKVYYDAVSSVVFSNKRNIKILYSPLHGTGLSSVFPVLLHLGFDVHLDKQTSNLSGDFENVTFNVPNPEIEQSFDSLIASSDLCGANIIMSTDPDADRLGLMVRHENNWEFFNGNQIGIILVEYILKNLDRHKFIGNEPIVIKTEVTTSLISKIAEKNNAVCIDNLLVGFKYICDVINKLEGKGLEDTFVLGVEESNGYLVGTYCRDKDASGAAILIAELAATLDRNSFTLVDYINVIYSTYGYCHNNLTEIRFSGVKGLEKIDCLMRYFRESDFLSLGPFHIKTKLDRWKGFPTPHLSKSDTSSRNMISFIIKNLSETQLLKLTIRPSGTEPKLKIYVEIFGLPFNIANIADMKSKLINIGMTIEKKFLRKCYDIIGLNLPERSFLLFDQIDVYDKLRYFEVEKHIVALTDIANIDDRYDRLVELLSFLGDDAITKVDKAFYAKYGYRILTYLGLER